MRRSVKTRNPYFTYEIACDTILDRANRIRAALLTVVENYSAMGIERLPEFVDKDHEVALRILKEKGTEIVADVRIHDAQTMIAALPRIKSKDTDLMIINVIGWAGGEAAVILARETKDIPMMVWTTPTIEMALCGFFEFTSDLRSMEIPFKSIIGKRGKNTREVESYLKAVKLRRRLRSMRFAQIGDVPPGFVDATGDKVNLERKLGIKVINVDVAEVFSEIKKTRLPEVENVRTRLLSYRINQAVPEKALFDSLRVSIALGRVVGKHDLRGAGLRCLPELQAHSFPCLGVSTLSEKGIALACEGDLPAAITSVILNELTGNIPAVFDYDSIDPSRNSLRLWHCGHLAKNLVSKNHKMRLISPTYFDKVVGPGAVLSFSVKPGKVTLAKLDRKAQKMLVLSGETITPRNRPSSAYAEVRLECDVSDAIRMIAMKGLEHHVCLVHGDATSELSDFCDLLDIHQVRCEN